MSKTFAPITVLLIEDNPAQEGIKVADLKSRGIDIGSLGNNIDVPGINFKEDANKELHNLFTLKVLQHPEEIKEYISNCLETEDKEGSVSLGSLVGAVPEIVEFDYKLSDNFKINEEGDKLQHMKYWSDFKKLREHYNPNFLFGSEQHLEKKENENYTEKDFIERINKVKETASGDEAWYKKDEQQLKDDELGLYAGVEITRLFRNHVCIGIPATFNKDGVEKLHAFGKFYEWMNEYDLGTMFSREERGKKDWDSVISAAVKQLRIRIETQIQIGKATPDYSQLCALAEGNISDERIFSFKTIYGKRDLPLDGLFIDVTDPTERNTKITEWASGILNILPVENAIIKKARETAKTLWDTYLNDFEDRIVLSDYSSRNGSLNPTETAYFEEVRTKLGVSSTTGLIGKECSIQELLDKERGDDKKNIIRLTFLIVVAQAIIELEKQRIESGFDEKYRSFSKYEYVDLLFPKVNFNNTVLLSMHIETDKDKHTDKQRSWLGSNMKTSESKVTKDNFVQIENWISKGEKEILKSFFYKDSEYFPQWFK